MRRLVPDGMVTAPELVSLSGASYRQVHYWTSSGRLVAEGSLTNGGSISGSGSVRLYPESEVLKARLLVALLNRELMADVALILAESKVAEIPGGFTVRLTKWASAALARAG